MARCAGAPCGFAEPGREPPIITKVPPPTACGLAGLAAANGFGASAAGEPGLAVWPAAGFAIGAAAAGLGEGEDIRKRPRASASSLAKTIAQAKAVATAILDTDASLVGGAFKRGMVEIGYRGAVGVPERSAP